MSQIRLEIAAIDISDDDEHYASVKCFDEVTSEIEIKSQPHNLESWRELSAKIEEALLTIHPAR